MDIAQTTLRRLDRWIWSGIALVAAAVLGAAGFGPFRFDWMSFAKAGSACTVLAAVGWYYAAWRKEPQLAAALVASSQVIAFAMVGAPLSYIAASAGLPLWDATFTAWDEFLHFDWPALLRLMNAYPALHIVFAISYASFPLQATAIIVALTWVGQLTRIRVFILAFMLATVVTIAISAVMPAEGVWGHLRLSKVDHPAIAPITQSLHLPIFHGLRDGTLRVLTGEGSEGIITFPSLHAALGLLFIIAAWPVPYMRWACALVNAIMIAATPVDGGHYFSDVIAGLLVAAVCWLAVTRIATSVGRARERSGAAATVVAIDAPSLVPQHIVAQPPQAETLARARERA